MATVAEDHLNKKKILYIFPLYQDDYVTKPTTFTSNSKFSSGLQYCRLYLRNTYTCLLLLVQNTVVRFLIPYEVGVISILLKNYEDNK